MGTNAHELPMAMAALARMTMRRCTRRSTACWSLWQKSYGGELLIMLPDTFGTTQFLEGAPDWVADWTGQRWTAKTPLLPGMNTLRGCWRGGAIRGRSG
jgi:nicotinate phosphoribosyltransferase